VSFDVVSLFTKIPINEAVEVINEITDQETAKLVEICLKSTFFSFQGEIYEQTCGVAMRSPLSPVITNLFMESVENKALASSPLKPKLWIRLVDHTFVIWPNGCENLDKFIDHLNNQSEYIKFIMEIEVDGSLPFLDVCLTKKLDGSLAHQVCRKKTHIEQYLHAEFHHHSAQNLGVLNTLATKALRISDEDHLEEEKSHLLKVFKNSGCNKHQGVKAFQNVSSGPRSKEHIKEVSVEII